MKYFYFYDCPRTGGTSFKQWSRRCETITRLHFGDDKGWHHVPFRPRAAVSELAPAAQRDKVFTFTLLRDPIEHTASLYAKIRRHKHSYRKRLSNLKFHQWVHQFFEVDRKESPAPWGFSMVRFYDPITGDVDRAISNIETMDFVGFTERLTQDMQLMLEQANARAQFDGRRLNPGIREFKVSPADRLAIKRIRFDDYQLVNHFREKRGLQPYG